MTVFTRRARRGGTALAGLTVAALTATACGGTGSDQAADDGELTVVATTNVWASVARAVGGPGVEVESIIDDPAADPHSYESSPQDAAKVGDADLVLLNGGGYDEFAEQILDGTGAGKPTVQAVEGEHEHAEEPAADHEHGHEHGGAPADEHAEAPAGHSDAHADEHAGHDHSVNEHVWYDLHVVRETADRVAEELGKIQPERAQEFRDNAARFGEQIGGLEGRVDQIAATEHGKKVIVTEPVAHYLVESAGLTDITPQSFVHSVEAGNDPAAAAVAEIQNAVNSRQAAAVIYNPQTESPVTESVRKGAEQNQTPVVEMTETLPQDQDYVRWMDGQISALQAALAGRP
ncbi:metal ABC transporter solute-binding protein [Saccharopolyspora gloriosae]|uniref:Zinc/manganese transport system substrate-binding protein n=1 Tax=Saccharopolyspora gloriosae TaxID=455344 RepID=A0A840NMC5_9PSEU|nr:zinc ABC transporter substrate-binding protein [Saccharopolyspora gloriosae]MBB5072241.1 zinc/manganese transport system substrate-binding protein [Saccharopolyspora gloriosae]